MFLASRKTTINTMGIRYFTCTEGAIYNVSESYHIQIHWKGSHVSMGFETRAERDKFYDELITATKGKRAET